MEGVKDDELFEVECFLDSRKKDGKRYYKVRWNGFPPEEDTWEPEENVGDCEEALHAYWEKKKKSANRKQKQRRYRMEGEDHLLGPSHKQHSDSSSSAFQAGIEPIGLTRQASKELAMFLNKPRDTSRQSDHSASQTGSDVTLTENDIFECNESMGKSDVASSPAGSDVTSFSNDFLNQSSGSECQFVTDMTDVIEISSQDSSFNADIGTCENLPNKNELESSKSNVPVISLLSDSEGDDDRYGTPLSKCGDQSPNPSATSRDPSPVEACRSPSSDLISEEDKSSEETTIKLHLSTDDVTNRGDANPSTVRRSGDSEASTDDVTDRGDANPSTVRRSADSETSTDDVTNKGDANPSTFRRSIDSLSGASTGDVTNNADDNSNSVRCDINASSTQRNIDSSRDIFPPAVAVCSPEVENQISAQQKLITKSSELNVKKSDFQSHINSDTCVPIVQISDPSTPTKTSTNPASNKHFSLSLKKRKKPRDGPPRNNTTTKDKDDQYGQAAPEIKNTSNSSKSQLETLREEMAGLKSSHYIEPVSAQRVDMATQPLVTLATVERSVGKYADDISPAIARLKGIMHELNKSDRRVATELTASKSAEKNLGKIPSSTSGHSGISLENNEGKIELQNSNSLVSVGSVSAVSSSAITSEAASMEISSVEDLIGKATKTYRNTTKDQRRKVIDYIAVATDGARSTEPRYFEEQNILGLKAYSSDSSEQPLVIQGKPMSGCDPITSDLHGNQIKALKSNQNIHGNTDSNQITGSAEIGAASKNTIKLTKKRIKKIAAEVLSKKKKPVSTNIPADSETSKSKLQNDNKSVRKTLHARKKRLKMITSSQGKSSKSKEKQPSPAACENNQVSDAKSSTLEDSKEQQSGRNTKIIHDGDLIGLIINEGEEKTSNDAAKTSHGKDPYSCVGEEHMCIDEDDDDDFDFELEDFSLEKLLQDEEVNYERDIPSPPVEPMDIPYASVKQAIREGDEMTVRAALAGGLELETLDGASGMTLLMLAAASAQDEIVELLLRRRADVNAVQKNGMSALMHACEQGCPETAHILLLCGADINKQQIAGETALMKACKKGHTDVIEVILKNGADTKLESKAGHMAYYFAARSPYPEIPTLLEEHDKRLGRAVEEAISKCLGDAVSICRPPILSHRCLVPREGGQMILPFQYSQQLYDKDVDIILFCIKAVFNDDVISLLFGEENGIRGVQLNSKQQIPLLHGIRSIFPIEPKPRQNTLTLQTHKTSGSKLIVCIYAVHSS